MMVMTPRVDLPNKHGEFMPLNPFNPPRPPRSRPSRKHGSGFGLGPEDEYLLLVKPKNGSGIRIMCSQKVKPHSKYILGATSLRFLERLSTRVIDEQTASQDAPKSQTCTTRIQNPANAEDPRSASITYVFAREPKRQRISSEPLLEEGSTADADRMGNDDASASNSRQIVELRLGDRKEIERWYQDAFQAIQQVVCRALAKTWIKRIQPKKQSTNPYNGACPKDKERPKDPNRTRPPYWPPHVQHKEPDHINREDRITLLVHLVTNTPQAEISNPRKVGQEPQLWAKDLKEAIEERRNTIQQDKWEIIEDIIRVRTEEERLQRGEIDEDWIVVAPDLSHESRRVRDQPETQVVEVDGDGQELLPAEEHFRQHELPANTNHEDQLHQDEMVSHLHRVASQSQLSIDTNHADFLLGSLRSTIDKDGEDSYGGFPSGEEPEYPVTHSQQITPTSEVSQGPFDRNWLQAHSRDPSSAIVDTNMMQDHNGSQSFPPTYMRWHPHESQGIYSPVAPGFSHKQQPRMMSISSHHPGRSHTMPHVSRNMNDFNYGHPHLNDMDLSTGYLGHEHILPSRSASTRPEITTAEMSAYDFNY